MLAATSIVMYIIATIDVAATLQQLLEAFIYLDATPSLELPQLSYASEYFLDASLPMAFLKNILYIASVSA